MVLVIKSVGKTNSTTVPKKTWLKEEQENKFSKASENSYKPQLHKKKIYIKKKQQQRRKNNHQQTVVTPPNQLWGFPHPPANQRQSNDVIMHWVGSCV